MDKSRAERTSRRWGRGWPLVLVALLSCLGADEPAAIVHPAASGRGRPIDLAAATPPATVRHGAPALLAALEGGAARPVSLLAQDLDGDGASELVEGFALPDGTGALVLHHGNPDATAPLSVAAREALAANRRIPAVEQDALAVAVPAAPDFLATLPGADGEAPALLFASRGGSTLFSLSAVSEGALAAPLATLPGRLTAVAPDGASRFWVGLEGEQGAEVQVLERRGQTLSAVATQALAAPATVIRIGELDGDGVADAAVLTGTRVAVLRGSGGLEALSLGFAVRALELGAFIPDRDPRAQLALLDTEGNVQLLAHGDFEGVGQPALRDPRLRGRPPATAAKAEGFADWRVLERFAHVAQVDGERVPLLRRTRISDHGAEDLAIYDRVRGELSVISHRDRPAPDQAFAPGELSTRPEPSAPIAVAPVRLSADPRPGMALLGETGVLVAQAVPNPTIVVNSTNDATSATLENNCLVGSGTCTLRAAVRAANARAGADTISLPAGTYTLTLAGQGENDALTGDLDVRREALTLNGSGAASTIIQAGSNATNGIDKVMAINPYLTEAFATVINNVTLRYGFNHSTNASGEGFGGAFDWEASGTGTLSLTNCVISDNQTTEGDGGGIFTSNGDSSTPITAQVSLTNVTFARNVARFGSGGVGGGIEVGASVKLVVNSSTFDGNQAPGTGGEGGAIYLFDAFGASQSTIASSTFTNNTAGFSGGAVRSGRGLDITSSTFDGNTVTAGSGGALALSALSEATHLTHSTLIHNTASATGGALYVTNGGPLDMHYNRVALNTAASTANLAHPGSGSVTASENWWACNVDPSSAACGKLSGVTTAQVSPFLLVSTSASPASLEMGDSLTVTGSMLKDSAGATQSVANLAVLQNLPVAFNNAQKAQVTSADTQLATTTFDASATLQAIAAGAGSVDVVVDGAIASAPFTVLGPDLTISKTDPGTFKQGDTNVPYTIQVTNSGAGRTDSGLPGGHPVVVTDTLPAGLTFVSVSGTGWTCSGTTTVTCSYAATLEKGQAAPAITLNVNVSKTAPTPLPNTATVAGGGEEASKTGNNSSTDNTPIKQLANLTVTKSHTGNFRQGQTGAQYLLTVHNAGTGPTDGSVVTLTDTLPSGLTATALSGAGWTCTLATLTCTTTAVIAPATDFPVLTLTVDVADDASTPLVNSAAVSGGGEVITDDNTASDATVVIKVADLTVSKSHTGNFRQGQTSATYTIVVHNQGPGPTIDTTTVTDTLPAGLTATGFAGTGWTCTLATATCTSTDVIAAGANFPTLTLTVDVAADAAPSVTNAVTVSGGGELVTTNDAANDVTTVEQVADLVVTKSHTGDFRQGDTGKTYTLTVKNTGPGPTVGTVTLDDTLPTGLTATAIGGTGWTCTLSPLRCTRSDALASGASFEPVTVTVDVAADAPASVTNTATVSGGGELATVNDTASDPTTVIQVADLTVTKTHSGSFRQGDTGRTYTLTVTNSGPGPTVGAVVLDDALPTGLTATAISGTGWTCTLSPLSCTRSDALTSGASYDPVAVTVDVAVDAPASVTNTATVSGGGELVTANDTASDVTAITQVADLTVVKSHTGDFTQGQTGATYSLVAHNVGPGPTTGTVTVTDTLPTGLTATAISGSGWTCDLASLTCTRSDVQPSGATYPAITLTVNVAITAPTPLVNTAQIGGGGELNTANDSVSDSTNVVQLANLTLSKTHSGTFAQGQTGAVYTLTVHNAGTGPTDGTPVTVTDTLPAGLTATSLAGTGWTCDLPTTTCVSTQVVAAGANFPAITLTVDVANTAAPQLTNTATVSGGGEIVTTDNDASDPTDVDQRADLTVAKSHAGSFRQGDTGKTYTLTVSNVGSGATIGQVTLTDALPTGLTATDIAGTNWSCDLPSLTCTRSDALAPSASYEPVTVTVDVDLDAPPSVTNVASVSGGQELNPANDSASDFTVLVQVADLTLTKSHTGSFTQGQSGATYALVVHNGGPGDTTGTVSVTDTLPTGLTATAIAGSGWTCDLASLSCQRADVLASGGDYPAITVTVDVAVDAGTPLVNAATVQGGGELVTTNDSATDSTVVNQLADLTLTKTHSGNFSQGQTGATYTLTVHNAGTGATDGTTVTVTDSLPSGLTATAMAGTGWICDVPTATCTRADTLNGGADFPAITLTVDVAPDAAGQLTNTATVAGGGQIITSNDGASDPTSVTQIADLTVAKSHAGSFRQGQTGASYTLTVSNTGDGPTTGTVTLVDTLPAGLTATGMSGTGWTCDVATATCTRSDALPAGSSYPDVTLLVTVAGNAPTSLTNTATVSGGGEAVTGNDTASDPTTVVEVADLAIAKSHVGDFTQGQTGAQYTLRVTNHGAGPTVGTVTVQDALPAGLTATAIAGAGWTCDLASLTCTSASALASSASAPDLVVTVDVAADAPASVTNTATVSGGGELNATDDSASDPTTVIQLADLTLTKTHTAVFAQGDSGLTYDLVVHNAGNGPSAGTVSVQDALPAGLTATSLSGAGWTCDLATLTCSRADALAAGSDFAPIVLTVDVAANAPAQVTNTATVSGGGEVITGNDGASDPTSIVQRADLTLTKSHTGDFRQGQTGASYTLVVHNGGPGPTEGTVTVVDTLPAGLTATALSGDGWTCDLASVTCTRTDVLAAGASYPAITLTVDVAPDAPAQLTNAATVSGGAELDTGNDGATDATNVTAVADLTLTKTHTGSLVQGQTGVVYTLTVTNSGVGDTVGEVSVTDALPAGLTLTALSGAGWTCGLDTATCTRSDVLAAGSSYPAIDVTVDISSTAPTSITNVATVSGGGELDTSNDSASDAASVAILPDLTVTSSHQGPFYAGQQGATYALVVTNAGGGPTLAEVSVVDTLPEGLMATAFAGEGWTCTLSTLTCTRSDALAAGASYPALTLTVDVAGSAPDAVNTAVVSGGGEQNTANDTASDPTVIEAAPAHGCGCAQTGGSADLALGALVLLAFCLRPGRRTRELEKGGAR